MDNELAKRIDPLLGRRGELLTIESLGQVTKIKVGKGPCPMSGVWCLCVRRPTDRTDERTDVSFDFIHTRMHIHTHRR